MPILTRKPQRLQTMLLDDGMPVELRKKLLAQLCMDGSDEATAAVGELLGAASKSNGEAVYEAKIEELSQKLQALEQGPLRQATFLHMSRLGESVSRAAVALEDGTLAYVPVSDDELAQSLRCGETVLLEAQGRALICRAPGLSPAGEEARLERRLEDGRVEATVRDHERVVLRASAALTEKLDGGTVGSGACLVICPRRMMAFDALPAVDGLGHYRYVVRRPVPDVVVDRDLGAPPQFIEDLVELVRLEMSSPAARRCYGLYRCALKLLAGVSGSGKSYGILALWRRLYDVMSEVTGVPIDDLPHRVMRLRASEVLSKWLGDSDKNLARFFDEAEQLAEERFVAGNGHSFELPVLCIIEEADGLFRARGHEPVYDRILTTALERMDTTRPELRDKLILFVATTNVPHQVDHAFLRRIGGTIERFGRLRRPEFVAVLDKHLQHRPLINGLGGTGGGSDDVRRAVIADVIAWLYRPRHADAGEVELTYAGSARRETKYGRDLITASLIDRAVQYAGDRAARAQARGEAPAGLTSRAVIEAIEKQLQAVVGQLSVGNAHEYISLPDGERVAGVRRLPQPSIAPIRLERPR